MEKKGSNLVNALIGSQTNCEQNGTISLYGKREKPEYRSRTDYCDYVKRLQKILTGKIKSNCEVVANSNKQKKNNVCKINDVNNFEARQQKTNIDCTRELMKSKNSSDNDDGHKSLCNVNNKIRQYKRSNSKDLKINEVVGNVSKYHMMVQNNQRPGTSSLNTAVNVSVSDIDYSGDFTDLQLICEEGSDTFIEAEVVKLKKQATANLELQESKFSFQVVEDSNELEDGIIVMDVNFSKSCHSDDKRLCKGMKKNSADIAPEIIKPNAEGKYPCTRCDQTYVSVLGFKKHTMKCKGKPYRCVWCEAEFKRKWEMDNHLRVGCYPVPAPPSTASNITDSGVCEYCGKTVSGSKHNSCGICEICGKGYSNLPKHLERHKGTKTYKCPECNKAFSNKQSINNHIKYVHRKQKPWYYCSRCPVRNRNKAHVVAHEKIHDLPPGAEVPKPFKCPCGSAFISQLMLGIHKNFQHKQRKCHLCGEVCGSLYLVQKHKLAVHNMGHSTKDKERLDCTICEDTLVGVQALSKHLDKVHGLRKPGPGRPLRCDLCPKTYHLFGTYIWHRKSCHGQDVTESELLTLSKRVTSTIKSAAPGAVIKGYQYNKNLKPLNNGETGNLLCEKCDIGFQTVKEFHSHKNTAHHVSKKLSCRMCRRRFKSVRCYWAHKLLHATSCRMNIIDKKRNFNHKGCYIKLSRGK